MKKITFLFGIISSIMQVGIVKSVNITQYNFPDEIVRKATVLASELNKNDLNERLKNDPLHLPENIISLIETASYTSSIETVEVFVETSTTEENKEIFEVYTDTDKIDTNEEDLDNKTNKLLLNLLDTIYKNLFPFQLKDKKSEIYKLYFVDEVRRDQSIIVTFLLLSKLEQLRILGYKNELGALLTQLKLEKSSNPLIIEGLKTYLDNTIRDDNNDDHRFR